MERRNDSLATKADTELVGAAWDYLWARLNIHPTLRLGLEHYGSEITLLLDFLDFVSICGALMILFHLLFIA